MSDDKQWWSLWSILARWQTVYSVVFAVLFIAGVILTTTYECCLERSSDGVVKSALDIIQGSAPVAIASAAFGLVGTEVVMTISEWYRAKRFAEGKAEGRIEGRVEERAEVIKALREQGFHAAAATLEAPAQEADTPPETPAKR